MRKRRLSSPDSSDGSNHDMPARRGDNMGAD